MTKFRLNAGRPAPSYRSGPSVSSHPAHWWQCDKGPCEVCDNEKGPRKPEPPFIPAMEKPTLLDCGDSIPWPIVQLLGSATQKLGRQVWCDVHGWQRVTDKEIMRAKRLGKEARQCNSAQLAMADKPPF